MPPLLLPDPPLEDELVRLRAWREDDVEACVAACADPEIARFNTAIPQPYRAADARSYFSTRALARETGESLDLAIADPATDAMRGGIGLHMFDWLHRCVSIGYWLAPQARGRGLMTAAARLLVRHAFDDLGLERVELLADSENERSLRVADALGFKPEGLLRGRLLSQGSRRDAVLCGLVRGELR